MARATGDLLTPAVLVDVARVEANLGRMQAYCRAHGLALRPHVKTHRLARFAQRQLALGAAGLTCQKVGEAEVMADAGCDDLLLSYEVVGERNLQRLGALARRCRITTVADSRAVVEGLALAARQAPISVLVDCDTGLHRTGVSTAAEALALARAVIATPGLSWGGLFTFPTGPATGTWLAEALAALRGAGLEAAAVSSGGTPGAYTTHAVPQITELRVGTYIYNDRATILSGAARAEDAALTVLSTVISANAPQRVILDAGSKALTSDLLGQDVGMGYGEVLEYPEARIVRLYEEHAVVDASACPALPAVGQRVRILPNHVCPVVNLFDAIALVSGQAVLEVLPVSARGRSQ